ncbi:MAG: SURF1 family protein [Acidimicrobiia bacterium]|nr:SURF1 family protein [Acidimicrobiia bacterium]
MYRFLLKPRWILSHLFVLVAVGTMINLGFWQLNRLDERKAANAVVTNAMKQQPQPLATVLPEGTATTTEQVKAADYQPVYVTGTYRADEQVLVTNRTNNGSPGYWVVTPLVLADGTAVAINRGWVPYSYLEEGPWDDFAPPPGTVTVQGLVRQSQVRETNGLVSSPKDSDVGTLRVLARLDVGRLAQQTSERMIPGYISLRVQDPVQNDLPVPVPLPELSQGTHLGYALQWFAFSLSTIIVYPLLLRRYAKRKQMDGDDAEILDGEPASPESDFPVSS